MGGEYGAGATFRFTLPLKAPREMTGGTPTVFIVDDDALVRRGVERLLRSAGFTAERLLPRASSSNGTIAMPRVA